MKSSLFKSGSRIAVQDMQAMANHRQVQRKRRGAPFTEEREKLGGAIFTQGSLEEGKSSELWQQQLLIAWVVAKQGENLSSSGWGM